LFFLEIKQSKYINSFLKSSRVITIYTKPDWLNLRTKYRKPFLISTFQSTVWIFYIFLICSTKENRVLSMNTENWKRFKSWPFRRYWQACSVMVVRVVDSVLIGYIIIINYQFPLSCANTYLISKDILHFSDISTRTR